MKKCVKTFLTLLLGLLMTVNVYADEAGSSQKPDIVTDYYMIVESPDGGVDLYAGASFDAVKLNDAQIPNGTAFHIEGEKEDESKRVWGYVQYHGMYGYVPEDDLKPATRSEAIESELYIAGSSNVDYNADYDVEPRSDAGSISMYQGPGEKYGKVSGDAAFQEGDRLHVSLDANLADGSHWAEVEAESGASGWVNMEQTKEYGTEDPDNTVVNMEVSQASETDGNTAGTGVSAGSDANASEASSTAENGEGAAEEAQDGELLTAGKADLTPTPEATLTPTPKPTSTPTPSPEPTKEPTPTAEPTETPTPTAEPTEAVTPTEAATPTAEPTEEATPTAEPTEEPEETPEPTKEAEEADSKEASAGQVTSTSSLVKNPFVWIAIVIIIAVIVLLIYHFKKRDKE